MLLALLVKVAHYVSFNARYARYAQFNAILYVVKKVSRMDFTELTGCSIDLKTWCSVYLVHIVLHATLTV